MATDIPQPPPVRTCATDKVHDRLLRDVPDYAASRGGVENAYFFAGQSFDDDEAARTELITIPVVVHIVGNPERTGAVTDEQVHRQIEVLNADYSATNDDISAVPEPFRA